MSCIIRGGIVFLALTALWNASCVVDAWTTVPAATAFSGAFSSGNVKDSATIDHVRSLSAFATANAGGKLSRGRKNGALYSTRAASSSDRLLTGDFQLHETLFVDHENNVGFRIMELNDIEATLDAVVESFAKGEPLGHSFGITVRDYRNFTSMWIHRMALEGNAVVAFDINTSEILGAFLNEDFQNSDPEEIETFLAESDADFVPGLGIIADLEDALMSKHEIPSDPADRPSGQFFHMWMLGVSPESRGRGIGRNLFRCSCMLAQEKGFRLAFAECTGAISTHLFREYLGADVESFVDYSTYDGPGDEAINKIPKSGHKGASLMTVDLTSSTFK